MNLPLSLVMESAKKSLNQSFNDTLKECGLPAYLVEGMLCELLAEVRNQKNLELLSDIQKYQNQKREECVGADTSKEVSKA